MTVEQEYDPTRLLAQAAEWRRLAEQEAQPARRAQYVADAARYEMIVRRSLEVPTLAEPDGAQAAE